MSRFVLDSNNLWLIPLSDNTILVKEGPVQPNLNTHKVPFNFTDWKQAARIGTNRHCTHRELEVFGVVFSGQKQAEIRKVISDQQSPVNREGFMFSWLNPRSASRSRSPRTVMRRINDLFDWSKYGVQVPLPLQTEWDRFEMNTGKLMVQGAGSGGQVNKEKEEENQRLQKEMEELKKQQAKEKDDQLAANKENEKRIQELEKQAKEKDDQLAANKEKEAEKEKEIQELKKQAKEKDDELAAKNRQIRNLQTALASFT